MHPESFPLFLKTLEKPHNEQEKYLNEQLSSDKVPNKAKADLIFDEVKHLLLASVHGQMIFWEREKGKIKKMLADLTAIFGIPNSQNTP